MAKKRKSTKRRKPKGKRLSERLEEKDARKAAADQAGQLDDEDEDEEADEPSGGGERASDGGAESERVDPEDEPRAEEEDLDDDDDVVDAAFEDEDEDEDDEDADGGEEERGDADDLDEEDRESDDVAAAAQMGHQRYVMAGFFGLWLVAGYICGRFVEMLWAEAASRTWFRRQLPWLESLEPSDALISRASIALAIGVVIGAAIVFRYYFKPEVRTWADEVAEQLAKVKWPTRKEVGNNTVVVIVASAVITLYLTLLDRFWGYVTNMIYVGGA